MSSSMRNVGDSHGGEGDDKQANLVVPPPAQDWEDLSEDPVSLYGQLAAMKAPEVSPKNKRQVKQHGRGVFTFGEMDMYSDSTAQCPNSGESVGTSTESKGTDWEGLSEDPASLYGQLAAMKVSEARSMDKKQVKQRGRGAFTFGEMGLYSDKWPMQGSNAGESVGVSTETAGTAEYGNGHVLIVDGFQPTVTTKDLEELFKPFIKRGVTIRWVNDTTALAIFPNPAVAQEALQCIRNPNFKMCLFDNESHLCVQLDKRDFEPPVTRPATSPQAAQRMIVGALGRKGLNKMLQPKTNFQEIQKQEDERKKRLLNRHRLRDEAWGPDD